MDDLLDYIPDGVFTVDANWCITLFNRAAEQITGIPHQDAIGRRCCDVFRASICESACALKQTLATGRPVVNKVVYVVDAKGQRIPISISTAVLKDAKGKVVGGVESFRDLRVVEELHRQAQEQNRFADIIGRSAPMRRIFEILPAIAGSDSTVLIEGASGTGKELFARAIHKMSKRRTKKLVAINCGALPDTLLESELFGYKAGAFTDARRDKPGRFALAEGGTIFLDEIGDISPAMQTRLLRVLQERVYEPLGSVDSVKTNVRELENIIEHAFVLCRGGLIEMQHLPPHLRPVSTADNMQKAKGMTLQAVEEMVIGEALRRNQGNKTRAAKEMGIDASTLFRKIKTLKLDSPTQTDHGREP